MKKGYLAPEAQVICFVPDVDIASWTNEDAGWKVNDFFWYSSGFAADNASQAAWYNFGFEELDPTSTTN